MKTQIIDTIDKKIGHSLRVARVTAGVKQQDLAIEVGVNNTYISSIEAGRRCPSISLLKRIAVALDIPLGRLLLWVTLEDRSKDE